jgi:predicted Zn-dependent protease
LKPRRRQRLIASLALALFSTHAATISPAAVNLPNIGESTEAYLSTEEEQNYGEAFMRSIRQSLELVSDPEVEAYIEALGNRLVANAGIRDRRFAFFVVKDPTINAFAGPGGYVGVDSGLIIITQSEAELASVMAHEIGHVTQRHIARAFEAASRMSAPMTAAIIAALILGSRGSGQAGEAAIAATAAGSTQQQINFTRSNEEEADRVGLKILADSGYEPRAMPRFFEHLAQATQYYDNLQLEFLRTHPVTDARISDTRNRAEQYPAMKETIGENYQLIRQKVRLIQDANPRKSLEYFEASLREARPADRDPLRYGYALALNASGRYAEARTQLEPLIAREPERVPYQLALADSELGQGRIAQALAIYDRNLAIYPYNLPLTVEYATALLQDRQAEKAAAVLDGYLLARPARPELYRLLGQARDMAGDRAGAHQALAEMYYLLGETRSSIEQLKIAIRGVPDKDVRAARIRERMRALQSEWKAKAKYSGETAQAGMRLDRRPYRDISPGAVCPAPPCRPGP